VEMVRKWKLLFCTFELFGKRKTQYNGPQYYGNLTVSSSSEHLIYILKHFFYMFRIFFIRMTTLKLPSPPSQRGDKLVSKNKFERARFLRIYRQP
jgi:hypothetical protein